MSDDFDLGDVLYTDIAGKEWRWDDLSNRDKMYYYELRRYWPHLPTADMIEKVITQPQPQPQRKKKEPEKHQFSKGFICGTVFGLVIAYALYMIIITMSYL